MRDRLGLRRPVRMLLGIALVGTLAWGATYVPLGLARMDTFRVTETSVDGIRYLTHAEVLAAAGIPAGASVWDDFDVWVERLRDHPLIEDAAIVRELPGILRISVVEREAVALVATPMLEAVDRDGRRLPMDPTRIPMDLPVIRLPEDPAQAGRPPSAARIRPLARVAERMRWEVTFWTGVSELTVDEAGAIRALWGDSRVEFRIPLDVEPYRLRDAVTVLRHALDDPARAPRNIDLRYDEQIVVRYSAVRGT